VGHLLLRRVNSFSSQAFVPCAYNSDFDSFISDAMGQGPLIQDGTFTTRLPADVDEEQFGPSSTSLPLPIPRRAGGDPTEVGFAYFIQKCRFVPVSLIPILIIDVSTALRNLSRASNGDIFVIIRAILQSPRLNAQNNSSLKSRAGYQSSQECSILMPTTPTRLHYPAKSLPHQTSRPSVASSRSLPITSY
jgi:hypothetical protein